MTQLVTARVMVGFKVTADDIVEIVDGGKLVLTDFGNVLGFNDEFIEEYEDAKSYINDDFNGCPYRITPWNGENAIDLFGDIDDINEWIIGNIIHNELSVTEVRSAIWRFRNVILPFRTTPLCKLYIIPIIG